MMNNRLQDAFSDIIAVLESGQLDTLKQEMLVEAAWNIRDNTNNAYICISPKSETIYCYKASDMIDEDSPIGCSWDVYGNMYEKGVRLQHLEGGCFWGYVSAKEAIYGNSAYEEDLLWYDMRKIPDADTDWCYDDSTATYEQILEVIQNSGVKGVPYEELK